MKKIDLTEKRFGRLIALKEVDKTNHSNGVMWLCQCDCGNVTTVVSGDLRSGHTKSCGCLLKDTRIANGKKRSTHGQSNTRLYEVWHGMKARCYRTTHPHYQDYGGRGIAVCDEWKCSFQSFSDWAYSVGYDEKAAKWICTLDRIDNDGDYSPSNCRWVDMYEQATNKRNSTLVTIDGVTKTARQWSKITGISNSTIGMWFSKHGAYYAAQRIKERCSATTLQHVHELAQGSHCQARIKEEEE